MYNGKQCQKEFFDLGYILIQAKHKGYMMTDKLI